MAVFGKYVGDTGRFYSTLDLGPLTNGVVVDFTSINGGSYPADGRWQSDAGPATYTPPIPPTAYTAPADHGLFANRPAAAQLANQRYVATDLSIDYYSDGSTWYTLGSAASGSGWPPGVIDATAAPYGAVADGREAYDGATTSGQPTVISATLAPTAADIGKTVVVCSGAGGTVVTSTVSSVNAGTNTITLAGNVTFTSTTAIVFIGTDNTAALQAAHNAGGAVGLKSGKYLLAAAQTTGTVTGTGISAGQSFAYTGQILTPARASGVSMKHYAFVGAEAPAGPSGRFYFDGPPDDAAVTILSAATTGAVFAPISTTTKPGTWYPDNTPWSHVLVDFDNVAIRTLPGFPIKAIAGKGYAALRGRRTLIDIAYSGHVSSSIPHASSVAFESPSVGNSALVQFEGEVLGYGTAFTLTEWGDIDARVQSCKVGYSFLGGGHLNRIRGMIQNTDLHILGNSAAAYLTGNIGVEITSVFLSDPSFELHGELVIHRGDLNDSGLPIDGTGSFLNIKTVGSATGILGSFGQPIRDSFARAIPSATKMHATDQSNHVWQNGENGPVFNLTSGKAVWVSGWGTKVCPAPPSNSTVSRATITLASTTAGAAGISIRDGQASQTALIACLEKDGSHDQIVLVKLVAGTPTILGTLTTAGLVLGSTYDLSVLYDQPVKNGPAVVTVYLGGVQKLQVTLSSGDQALFGVPVNCGIASTSNVVNDNGSSFSYYECLPA